MRLPSTAAALCSSLLVLAPAVALAQAGTDSVTLVWTAPGDDGHFGTASGYELRQSTSPIDEATWSAAAVVSGAPAPLPAGSRQTIAVRGLSAGTVYYFALKSFDEAGNLSPISNVVRWDWVYDTPWAIEPGYPNPSRAGSIVRIPLVVPAGGGSARVEIVNRAGQRVRVLDLGSLTPGRALIPWDGKNDAGREVAPGVYTAWLTAPSTRVATRMVRVP